MTKESNPEIVNTSTRINSFYFFSKLKGTVILETPDYAVYYSTKKQDEVIELNGKVSINGRLIQCNDLSWRFLRLAAMGMLSTYQEEFGTEDAIKQIPDFNSASYLTLFNRDIVYARADAYYFFSFDPNLPALFDHFGERLFQIAANMESNDTKFLLIIGTGHFMAITLTYDEDHGFIMHAFDPMLTAEHRIATCKSKDSLKQVQMIDLFDQPTFHREFSDGHAVIGVFNNPLSLKEMTVNKVVISHEEEKEKSIDALFSYALFLNDLETMEETAAILIKNAEQSGLLQDVGKLSGLRGATSAFAYSLERNVHEAVCAYIRLILNSHLSENYILLLLESKNSHEVPMLFFAYYDRLFNILDCFFTEIGLSQHISMATKKRLIKASRTFDPLDDKIKNSLFEIMQKLPRYFNQETIQSFGAPQIKILSPSIKRKLLVAMRKQPEFFNQSISDWLQAERKTPSLCAMFQYGKVETIEHILKLTPTMDWLDEASKKDFLACKTHNGVPGLFYAFLRLNLEDFKQVVMIFIKSVLFMTCLHDDNKVSLILANFNGCPSIKHAYAEDPDNLREDVIREICHYVQYSPLSAHHKEQLLAPFNEVLFLMGKKFAQKNKPNFAVSSNNSSSFFDQNRPNPQSPVRTLVSTDVQRQFDRCCVLL